jgi:hypothetical protein
MIMSQDGHLYDPKSPFLFDNSEPYQDLKVVASTVATTTMDAAVSTMVPKFSDVSPSCRRKDGERAAHNSLMLDQQQRCVRVCACLPFSLFSFSFSFLFLFLYSLSLTLSLSLSFSFFHFLTSFLRFSDVSPSCRRQDFNYDEFLQTVVMDTFYRDPRTNLNWEDTLAHIHDVDDAFEYYKTNFNAIRRSLFKNQVRRNLFSQFATNAMEEEVKVLVLVMVLVLFTIFPSAGRKLVCNFSLLVLIGVQYTPEGEGCKGRMQEG